MNKKINTLIMALVVMTTLFIISTFCYFSIIFLSNKSYGDLQERYQIQQKNLLAIGGYEDINENLREDPGESIAWRLENWNLTYGITVLPNYFDWPIVDPKQCYISCEYGEVKNYYHFGIDIVSPFDLRIYTAAEGEVIYKGYSDKKGNFIRIRHEINKRIFITTYAHLSEMYVEKGQIIKKRELIGIMGDTGSKLWCTAVHLHFGIQEYDSILGKFLSFNPLANRVRDKERIGTSISTIY